MKNIDKLAWIQLNNKAILSTKSYGKDKYYIPGGKREPGETDLQALCREIKEELTVNLDLNTVRYFDTFKGQAHGHEADTFVIMTCYTAAYFGDLSPNAEIEEVVWLKYNDIEKVSPVDKIIFERLLSMDLLD